MSLQDEYDYLALGLWAEENENICPCQGRGWYLSDLDTWHMCPYHFNGQYHPEMGEEWPENSNP